jgi:hypothetical protein
MQPTSVADEEIAQRVRRMHEYITCKGSWEIPTGRVPVHDPLSFDGNFRLHCVFLLQDNKPLWEAEAVKQSGTHVR